MKPGIITVRPLLFCQNHENREEEIEKQSVESFEYGCKTEKIEKNRSFAGKTCGKSNGRPSFKITNNIGERINAKPE